MVVVEIHETKHVITITEEQRPLLPLEPVVWCTCGWKEKGYGERDCQIKGNAHLAQVPKGDTSIKILTRRRR